MRLEKFKKLENHAWLKKSFKKLKQDEIKICLDFLKETQSLDKNDYAYKVVRMFLNKDKPKNWTIIEELLISCV